MRVKTTMVAERTTVRCVSIAGMLLVAAGCSGRPEPPSAGSALEETVHAYGTSLGDRPPASLLQVGYSATDLFDAAWRSDWSRADGGLRSLNEAALDLGVDLPGPDLDAKLQANIIGVTEGTNTRQRIKAMAAANAITQVVAELSAQYQPAVPYDVSMLGYYGRQIELGLASGRPTDSAQAVTELVTVWDRIHPAIVRRGHAADARQFTDLVVELMGATRADDFVAPVTAELAAASRLERIFTASQ